MAFSATVTGQSYQGQLRIIFGTWSGLTGDAAGTLSIGGYYLGSLWFKNDTSGATTGNQANINTSQVFPTVQWNGVVPGTLTIQNQDNVATGGFIVFTMGN